MPTQRGTVNETGRDCTRCGEFKPWEQFNRMAIGINGHSPHCRECHKTVSKPKVRGMYNPPRKSPEELAAGQAARQEARRAKLEAAGGRTCTKCSEFKPWGQFRAGRNAVGREGVCLVCHKAANKALRRSKIAVCVKCDRERPIEAKGICAGCYYAPLGRRRNALRRGASEMDGIAWHWRDLAAEVGMVCHYCKGLCVEGHPTLMPTVDHVVPLTDGGTHTRDNLVLACRSCNSSKGRSAA